MYKIGDKVKIRTDLEIYKSYSNGYSFIPEMDTYRGKIATITNISPNSYLIDLDNEAWAWVDDMFETKYSYNYNIYTNNDKIVITDGKYTKEYNNCSEESIISALHNFLQTKPWKPKLGQTYYVVDGINDIGSRAWYNDAYDLYRYEHGLVCKTEKEATELRDCITRAIKEFRSDL